MPATPGKYEDLTKAELIAVLADLESRVHSPDDRRQLSEDLAVHQEELRAQHEALRRSQELLQKSRDEYAELFDFAPVAYVTLNANGVLVAANLTACSLLGVERSRCLGLPLHAFLPASERAKFLEHIRRCRFGDKTVSTELFLQPRDGRMVPVEILSKLAEGDDSRPVLSRTAIIDLTQRRLTDRRIRDLNATLEQRVKERTAELEAAIADLRREVGHRRQAEQRAVESELRERGRVEELERLTASLKELDRRKDEFLAMLAHELRNPLGPLRNAVDVWRMCDPNDPTVEEMQAIIDRQVTQLGRIVDDLLDVSRITSGKIALREQPVDLALLIERLRSDLRTEFETVRLALLVELPTAPVFVSGDAVRLAQALGNLLHNARKFTDPGGEVTVRLTREEDSRQAVVSICDTGIGMTPESLDRIFGTFNQVDRSLDRSSGGLGLGLAVVKGLIELHRGTVRAESAGLGHGSCFTITLPLVEAPTAAGSRSDAPRPERHLRVLVIDDRNDAVFTMARLLTTLGHQVATAGTAEEGLETARRWKPEVIISDIGLPGTDGYAVARQARQDPLLRDTQLIAVTGYGSADDQARALEAGFDHHLTKPAGLKELQRLLG